MLKLIHTNSIPDYLYSLKKENYLGLARCYFPFTIYGQVCCIPITMYRSLPFIVQYKGYVVI